MKNLRKVTRVEAISFLILLFIAMPLKYLAGQPDAVRVMGMIHGLLFIAMFALAVMAAGDQGWPKKNILLLLLISSVPFGPFIWDRKLFN